MGPEAAIRLVPRCRGAGYGENDGGLISRAAAQLSGQGLAPTTAICRHLYSRNCHRRPQSILNPSPRRLECRRRLSSARIARAMILVARCWAEKGRNSCEVPTDALRRRDAFALAALTPGTRLNDTYEIDARIASGGMGEVYRGHNIETGEPVAIKIGPAGIRRGRDDPGPVQEGSDHPRPAAPRDDRPLLFVLARSGDRPALSGDGVRRRTSLADRIAAGPLDRDEAGAAVHPGGRRPRRGARGRRRPPRPFARQHNPAGRQTCATRDHRFRHRALRQTSAAAR